MINKFEKLITQLKKNPEYFTEDGKILNNKIYEDSLKMDENLLKLLLEDSEVKKMFFKEVNNTLIFDKVEFGYVINNKSLLPSNYTKFSQNIGLADSQNKMIINSNDVVLNFPYKDCLLEFDSTDTDEERNETFYNEVLARDAIDVLEQPKVFTNIKEIKEESETACDSFDLKDNLIIKGNNLLVMNSLLKNYEGKIKFMYWDILYNTQSDKVPYNDRFKESSWLVMMKNRLQVAYKLLSPDGVICLQCDDNEQAYLTVLCDEIFKGKDKRLNTIVVEMASTGGVKRSHKDKRFLKQKEYILVYCKSAQEINSLYDEWSSYDTNYTITFDEKNGIGSLKDEIANLKEIYAHVKISQYLAFPEIYEYLVKNRNRIFRRHGPSRWAKENVDSSPIIWRDDTKSTRNMVVKVTNPENPEEYEYLMRINSKKGYGWERLEPLSWNYYDGKFKLLRGDLWKDFYKIMGNINKEGGVKLDNGKKPEQLVYDLIKAFSNNKDDIIMDAYLGTGTTAAVAHMMGRQYIGIEQLDKHMSKTIRRMKNLIDGNYFTTISKMCEWEKGGSFKYMELLDNNSKYIEKINNAKNDELVNLWKEIQENAFISYNVDINEFNNKLEEFSNLDEFSKKEILLKVLDKNMLYVNYSDINDLEYKVNENDKKFNKEFYN